MIDLLVTRGLVVTMDAERSLLAEGAVAIDDGRILEVGDAARLEAAYSAREVIDARRSIVLPGLIDAHGHGGHSLLKTIASDTPNLWGRVVTNVYFHHTSDEFWYVEGLLSALERLRFGVTCGLSVIGSQPRSDDPVFASNHAKAYAEVGLREVVAVGPRNPPWPQQVSRWRDGRRERHEVTFEDALDGAARVIEAWHGGAGSRIRVYLTPFVIVPSLDTSGPTPADVARLTPFDRQQARRVREVARHHGTRIHSDAFGGMVRLAASDPHGLLGPDVSLQHCTGLSHDEVRILADTDTRVGHAPMSGALLRARCPVPELLEAGVTVAIVTDGTSPRTTFDLLPQTRAAIRLHQLDTRSSHVLPPGKALEMITIDAARALGLEDEIGSLEAGKRADLILVDTARPHLTPAFMPVHRLVFAASGHDVTTVIVDGQVRLRDGRATAVNEGDILEQAEREARALVARAGLEPFMTPPEGFWRSTYAHIDDDRAERLPR